MPLGIPYVKYIVAGNPPPVGRLITTALAMNGGSDQLNRYGHLGVVEGPPGRWSNPCKSTWAF